jgi:hypothetical protein
MKVKILIRLFFGLHLLSHACLAQKPVALHWLENTKTSFPIGVSWGVPFGQGKIKATQSFSLANASGQDIPLQQWNMAYWPDGSLKWVGFAAAPNKGQEEFSLNPVQKKTAVTTKLTVKETAKSILVNTGTISCQISTSGASLVDSLKIQGKLVGVNGHLLCIKQDAFEADVLDSYQKEKFISKIGKVTIEQKGPVRVVIKVEGKFHNANREWLPFIVRLYFYEGVDHIKLIHTILYDGDQQKDFIKGLGLVIDVPLREEILNRHIRFGGEERGILSEPMQPVFGRRSLLHDNKDVYPDQIAGKRIPDTKSYNAKGQALVHDWAVWSDFKLVQNNGDGFTAQKRTNPQSAWIDMNGGKRASGLIFAGDVSGGLSVSIKDFWQSYPAALEVKDMNKEKAELRAWLWSPYGETMDMRHYDTLATGHGLEASYEDVQPGFSTATGVGRTSEMTIFLHADVPTNEVLSEEAALSTQKPLLTTTPAYLHDAGAFGTWSLKDTSTTGKKWLEGQLDNALGFYQTEIDNRRWYGFWNYGDVTHSYDSTRHSWKYDMGGAAWANTELAPDIWLWYSYLRSGRADVFRMAEAMTRHTSEVDVYHIGRFAGLGSRHNVRHWGCGSKEVRISQAALKRYYYYLTTDERTGDLMKEVVNADEALVITDPLRLILPKSEYPTHARIGPDWTALIGNWMTEWERTNDTKWRDKILAGVNSFAKMPYGFYSGKDGAFGYDPKDGKFFRLSPNDIGNSHLATIMGGAQVAFELTPMLNNPAWNKLWQQYFELYGASKEDIVKAFGREVKLGEMSPHYARMPAYLAKITGDKKLADKAWKVLLDITNKPYAHTFNPTQVTTPAVLRPMTEIKKLSTNNVAQWSLNAIELLELIGKDIPEHHPLWDK